MKTANVSMVAAVQRPKRGRRRKRPELSDEQRRALRAMQNRQATRRSRERTRAKAELLKTKLKNSESQRQALKAECDRLLAKVNRGECTADSSQDRRNPMSLSVILNDDHEDVREYVYTPPPRRSGAMSCETSPISISSPSSQTLLPTFQKTVHDFT